MVCKRVCVHCSCVEHLFPFHPHERVKIYNGDFDRHLTDPTTPAPSVLPAYRQFPCARKGMEAMTSSRWPSQARREVVCCRMRLLGLGVRRQATSANLDGGSSARCGCLLSTTWALFTRRLCCRRLDF